jgi:phospholipase D1/2
MRDLCVWVCVFQFVEGAESLVGIGKGYSQYYATVDLVPARVGRTRVLKGQVADPVWDESFKIYCAHTVADVQISIKDDAVVGSAVIGRAKVPAAELLSGAKLDDWYPLFKENGDALGNSHIRFSLQFFAASDDPNWGRGIKDPRFLGVPRCYFPQRKGCNVTLYQDSHMADGFLPTISQTGNTVRQPTHCWEDVFKAITDARYLIYVIGWSVTTSITLVRDPQRPIPGSEGVTLGELLKKKADEGVRVNLLVWDDKTSVEYIHKDGVMGTNDQETLDFFANTKVNCLLCPRNPDDSLSVIQGFEIGTLFTHHQKRLVVDAPVVTSGFRQSEQRRIVSFVGGIDLCLGRYDTQHHPLFSTLNTVHSKDFHQPNFTPANDIKYGGPQEPWHDIHSRLEGPVAWDVLFNFEQHWKKQAGATHASLLLSLPDIPEFDPPSEVSAQNDPDTWNVQFFRSIDAGAAFGFPEDPKEAAKVGLSSGKDNTIDHSIHDAYINAIRCAKDFIYIENQYFMGSSYAWEADQDAGALHLILAELALKIVNKIEAGERFSVYIVVPMWPDCVPESGTMQAMLHWQNRTMQMMYKQIADALRIHGITDQSPKDYLSFFCLGNMETQTEGEYVTSEKLDDKSDYKQAQVHRRFMIYVHAKMMIVDDEYIIIGSANINQRSMDGGRDTESAMGAYQPFHLAIQKPPRSHIHGFRMALWYEHAGILDNAFLQPSSLECIRLVNSIGEKHWDIFLGDEIVNLPGQLLTYPVAIANDGTVSSRPDMPHFPDTTANILGTLSDILPAILTT